MSHELTRVDLMESERELRSLVHDQGIKLRHAISQARNDAVNNQITLICGFGLVLLVVWSVALVALSIALDLRAG